MIKKLTLKQVAEIAKPFDEPTHKREAFKDIITRLPMLEEEFQSQLTEEFFEQIEKKGLYFIIDFVRGSFKCNNMKNKVLIRYIGEEELPTVKLCVVV